MPLKRILITGSVLVLIVLALVWHFRQQEPLAVWVATVDKGPVVSSVSNTRAGTVKACRRSKLTMPIGGVVDRLLVDEGDRVEQGQLLLELWNRDRAADVEQAEETLKAAEYDRETACIQADLKDREASRIRQLHQRKLTSEENVDAAETAALSQRGSCEASRHQASVAAARLSYQQAVLERSQLRAPFAGVVAEVNGEVGEYITPSPPGIPTPAAVDLIDYSCLYVTAPIDEVDASRLQLGLEAEVTLDAFRGQKLKGKVSRIAPYVLDLEKQARTVDVDVSLADVPESISLLVGYSADIAVILERRERVMRIPSEAILPDDSVWVLSPDGLLEKRQLQLGIANWSFTEVLSGLAEGEWVVSSPDTPGLAEGLPAVAADD